MNPRVVLEHLEANRVLAGDEFLQRVDANVEVIKKQIVVGPITPVLSAQNVCVGGWLRRRLGLGQRKDRDGRERDEQYDESVNNLLKHSRYSTRLPQVVSNRIVSYFAVFLWGFAPLRESSCLKRYFTQRRQDAKIRKVENRTLNRSIFAFGSAANWQSSDFVNRTATILRAAVTTPGIRQKCLFVIYGDFIAGFYIAPREKQNVPVQRLHVSVGVAGMIDVVRAVAAARAIQTEAPVDITDAQVPAPARSLHSFEIRDSLAGVFSDLFSTCEGFRGETTLAVDR